MDIATFHAQRRFIDTDSGRIAYVEQGTGPVALFIHGVPLNGFHWRHVMTDLRSIRRCIALDLMGLGYSEISPSQDVSFTAQAQMILQFLSALSIEQVDLIANDSGGAIAQIFAAHNPERLRSLTLTNCDVHDNWPPTLLAPSIEAARNGTLIDVFENTVVDANARRTRFSRAYAHPTVLTDDVIRVYIDPLCSSQARRDQFHRYWTAFDNRQTIVIEPLLRQLAVPTLIVWGLDDIFFDVKWAHWLHTTIPGVVRVIELPGAKLFFPEDRPQTLIDPLRQFLTTGPTMPETRN